MRFPKEELPQWLMFLLLGMLGSAAVSFGKVMSDPFLKEWMPSIPPQSLLWLAMTSILLNILLAWLVLSNQLHFWKRNYVEDLEHGFYAHKKTKRKICAYCFLDGIESPLFGKKGTVVCLRKGCEKHFDYTEPET